MLILYNPTENFQRYPVFQCDFQCHNFRNVSIHGKPRFDQLVTASFLGFMN